MSITEQSGPPRDGLGGGAVKGFPNETPEEFDLREQLYAYERRYGMSSGYFLERYDRRELAPDPDLEEWRRLCLEAKTRRIALSRW